MDKGYIYSFSRDKTIVFPCEDLPCAPVIAPLSYEFSTPKKLDLGLGIFKLHTPYQCQDIRVNEWRKIPVRDLFGGVKMLLIGWTTDLLSPGFTLVHSHPCRSAHLCSWGAQERAKVGQDARRFQKNIEFWWSFSPLPLWKRWLPLNPQLPLDARQEIPVSLRILLWEHSPSKFQHDGKESWLSIMLHTLQNCQEN